jgi:hypothetical protein
MLAIAGFAFVCYLVGGAIGVGVDPRGRKGKK